MEGLHVARLIYLSKLIGNIMAHEGDEFTHIRWFYTKIYNILVIMTTAQQPV
jgi:hypothetical protein